MATIHPLFNIRNSQVVIDLVASLLYSQWTLPSRAPNQCESIEQVALRNMALVHRSWTGIAQYWLSCSIFIPLRKKSFQLPKLLFDYRIGTWVSELVFRDDTFSAAAKHTRLSLSRSLCAVLRRCTNLKSLYLEVKRGIPLLLPGEYDVLDCIGQLKQLQNLWLHQPAWLSVIPHPYND